MFMGIGHNAEAKGWTEGGVKRRATKVREMGWERAQVLQ